jgi:hypothetical protein
MAARRCSTCSNNYGLGQAKCPTCGGELWYAENMEPDAEADLSTGSLAVGSGRRDDPEGWRIEQYVRIGFTYEQACALSQARDARGFFLYWGDVEVMLRNARATRDARAARDVVFSALA